MTDLADTPAPQTQTITDYLLEVRGGECGVMDRLFPAVYEQLRAIAHNALRRERADHTLGTTGLVHEDRAFP